MASTNNDPSAYPAYAWLSGVLPVQARRFRVFDEALAERLRSAGAEITGPGSTPDVEIAPASEIAGDARFAIVPIDTAATDTKRLARAGRRVANSIRVRTTAMRARRVLREAGYPSTAVILWDVLHHLRLPWLPPEARSRRAVERFPQRALVLGMRSARPKTILEAATADAAVVGRLSLDGGSPVVRAEVLVLVQMEAVLRIGVGPGGQEIKRQADALKTLHAQDVPRSVAVRVPHVIATGASGIAEWSVERRLPGIPPPRHLSAALLAECVDFLVDLHSLRSAEDCRHSCARLAESVAQLADRANAETLRDLGERLDGILEGLPRGFGHADFGRGNLLVDGDRLVGVVDWDGAGPGKLPLLSLFHLRLGAAFNPQDEDWGEIIVDRLLPWATAGGDDVARDYCRRVGFEPTPELLQALALAFWLDLIALHVRLHPFRRDDRTWIRRNVNEVIHALKAEGGLGPTGYSTRPQSG